MSTPTEREQFEAWILKADKACDLTRDCDVPKNYADWEAHIAWAAWQARASQVAAPPAPHKIYQHYKGGRYEYLCAGKVERDGADMVVYRSQDEGTIWIRPAAEFYGWFIELTTVAAPPALPASTIQECLTVDKDSLTTAAPPCAQPAEQAELSDSEIMFLAGKHHVEIQGIQPVLDFARSVLAAAKREQL